VLIFVIKASVLPLLSRSKRGKPKVMCKLISPFVLAGEIAILFAADIAMRFASRKSHISHGRERYVVSRVMFFPNGKTAEIGGVSACNDADSICNLYCVAKPDA